MNAALRTPAMTLLSLCTLRLFPSYVHTTGRALCFLTLHTHSTRVIIAATTLYTYSGRTAYYVYYSLRRRYCALMCRLVY